MTPYIIVHVYLTIVGIALGIFASRLHTHAPRVRAQIWARYFLIKDGIAGSPNIRKRALFFTESASMLSFYAGLIAFSIVVFCFGLGIIASSFGIWIGPMIIFMSLQRNRFRPSFTTDLSSEMPSVALKHVWIYCSQNELFLFISKIATSKVDQIRITACKGCIHLPALVALPLLQKMQSDEVYEIKNLAKGLIAQIRNEQQQGSKYDISEIAALIGEHLPLRWPSMERFLYPKDSLEKLANLETEIVKHINANIPYTINYEQLFCTECLTFAERPTYYNWNWVWCRTCHKTTHLIQGITSVKGQIGGQESLIINGENITVSLWDPQLKKARKADIDTLEIIGGKDIDYDWAINAILVNLKYLGDRFSGFNLCLTDQPQLDSNSWRSISDHVLKIEERSTCVLVNAQVNETNL